MVLENRRHKICRVLEIIIRALDWQVYPKPDGQISLYIVTIKM